MKFDQVPAVDRRIAVPRDLEKISGAGFAECSGFAFCTIAILTSRNLNRDVRSLESGNLILVWNLGIGFVGRSVDEVQIQRVTLLTRQHPLVREADARGRGIGHVGEKDSLPERSSRH